MFVRGETVGVPTIRLAVNHNSVRSGNRDIVCQKHVRYKNINNISPLPQIPVFIMCSITMSSIPSIWIDYLPDMTNMWSSRFQWFVHTSFSPGPNRSCARDANHLNMNTKDDLFFQAHIYPSFGATALLITLTRVESIVTHRERVKPAYFVPKTSRYSESHG